MHQKVFLVPDNNLTLPRCQAHSVELAAGVNLTIAPRLVVSWEDFIGAAPPFSIALDGYVKGIPKIDLQGPYRNFNHHEDIDPSTTLSTCGQVFMALKIGLKERFQINGQAQFNLFVNDFDQDCCTSTWLLKNHERISVSNGDYRIHRLVGGVDKLDMTQGTYRFEDRFLNEMAWIYYPYLALRYAAPAMSGEDQWKAMEEVHKRIDLYVEGNGKEYHLNGKHYEILGGGEGWAMISELGPYAKAHLAHDTGVSTFVTLISEVAGRFHYSICKRSEYTMTPLLEFFAYLNELEGIDSPDRWDGRANGGGSPRLLGSKYSPIEFINIFNGFLERYKNGEAGKIKSNNQPKI